VSLDKEQKSKKKQNTKKQKVQKQKEKHGANGKRISPSQMHLSSQGEWDRTTIDWTVSCRRSYVHL